MWSPPLSDFRGESSDGEKRGWGRKALWRSQDKSKNLRKCWGLDGVAVGEPTLSKDGA